MNEDEMIALVKGCSALIVGTDPVSRAVMEAGPLRAVVKFGSGTDNIDLDAAKELLIAVGTTAGANARSVAELTIALLLSLARHVGFHDLAVKAGRWEQRRSGVELRGRRLGIVGLGTVGREVANIAICLGMEVVAYDPEVSEAEVPTMELETLLSTSDAVSLHAPLTDETRGLIDAKALKAMRRGALLVSTARGGMVDEDALTDALVTGHLGGAALDVFQHEPPEASPLFSLDNFIASPHAGAATTEAVERAGSQAVREALKLLGLKEPEK
jgi:phosphoglycerate dehydrogenase-like enzyme